MIRSKRSFAILLLIVGLLSIGGYYGYRYYFAPERNINRFVGQISNIDGEKISAYGVFKSRSGALPPSLSIYQNFIAQVNNVTTYTKEAVRWPTAEDLKKMGGSFDLKDLPRETVPGTFEEMKRFFEAGNTTYIEADFLVSIDKSPDMIASNVLYRVFLGASFQSQNNGQ